MCACVGRGSMSYVGRGDVDECDVCVKASLGNMIMGVLARTLGWLGGERLVISMLNS